MTSALARVTSLRMTAVSATSGGCAGRMGNRRRVPELDQGIGQAPVGAQTAE